MRIISARVRVTMQYDVSILINIGTRKNSLSGAWLELNPSRSLLPANPPLLPTDVILILS